jgi:hypothetical protein
MIDALRVQVPALASFNLDEHPSATGGLTPA